MSTTPAPHDETPAPRDQAWRLWIALIEQAAQRGELQRELDKLRSSRSWRLTKPLRAANAALQRLRRGSAIVKDQPALAPADPAAAVGASANNRSVPEWLRPFVLSPAGNGPRWLVDVTELARQDLGAGVERVSRRLLSELLLSPPATHRIEPVRLTPDGRYCLARRFLAGFVGLPADALGPDVPVAPLPGDILIGLDFCRDHAAPLGEALQRLRDAAVPVCLFVHDVLPVTHPEWFPERVARAFAEWLRVLAAHADYALCNSNHTALELARTLAAKELPLPRGFIAPIVVGSDMLPVPGTSPLPAVAPGTTRVLTVGTLEPRKAHRQMLDGFERLWREGQSFEWVIVGRQGWNVETLASTLRGHPEAGRRLFWAEGLEDGALQALYRQCDVLLLASRDEGFGLPIAEAGRLGMPLLLRDIPVFREVAGDAAEYFAGDAAEDIEIALKRWREAATDRRAREKRNWPTWEASADSLKSEVDRMLRSPVAVVGG